MAKKLREQIMERNNRKHRVMLARGLATPKGTKPKRYEPVSEPVFRPVSAPSMSMGMLDRFLARLGWKHSPHPEVPDKIEPKGIYKQ